MSYLFIQPIDNYFWDGMFEEDGCEEDGYLYEYDYWEDEEYE